MSTVPFRGHWYDLAIFADNPVFEALWPEEREVYDALAERWDGSKEVPGRPKIPGKRLERSFAVAEVLARFERFKMVRFERVFDPHGVSRVQCLPGEVALSIMARYRSSRAAQAPGTDAGG